VIIEQALYGSQDAGGYRFLARSPGFGDDWLAEAERLCVGFGDRPAGVACPGAVFAQPFGPPHVAVVQVADQGLDDQGRPGALAFRVLVLPRRLYADLGGDPFWLAEQCPPPWQVRGELPALAWTAGPAPYRAVAGLQEALKKSDHHSATLLGGAQVLLDGGRLVFERPAPALELLRDLWAMLPTASRAGLWPASFAFGNAHAFHALVVPRAAGEGYAHYVTENAAGDYPEGRYELALHTAIDNGDQAEVDALFARCSRAQVLRLGVMLLLVFLLVPLVVLNLPVGDKQDKGDPSGGRKKKERPAAAESLRLPPAAEFPTLDARDRARLAARLRALGQRLGADRPAGDSDEELSEAVVALDARIDARLGKKKSRRDPGPLARHGPPERQLRVLLYKHGVKDYAEPGLNPAELVERLEAALVKAGLIKEDGS
jgi:hypothetical protein